MTAQRSPGMRRNIELKARLRDPAEARGVAERLATANAGPQQQIDTYFHCRHGRLKLRQIDGLSAMLIAYHRPDQSESKGSDYLLTPVANPETLKQTLASALGLWVVVEKRREVYWWNNVRIHLDEVVGLGAFLEFEAVLDADHDDRSGHMQLARLSGEFGIQPADLVEGSYSNLLIAIAR
ncbi:MAG: class IV adenylate cyclase [Pirellulales bacterium]|nr:class IV adenylate cyclase [Pirellulales bacterium]